MLFIIIGNAGLRIKRFSLVLSFTKDNPLKTRVVRAIKQYLNVTGIPDDPVIPNSLQEMVVDVLWYTIFAMNDLRTDGRSAFAAQPGAKSFAHHGNAATLS